MDQTALLIFLSVFAYGHMYSNFFLALHWRAENVAWPAGGLQASVQNIEKTLRGTLPGTENL